MGRRSHYTGRSRASRVSRAAWKLRRRVRWAGLIVAVILALPAGADFVNGWWKAEGDCRVTAVIDGDTLAMTCQGSDATRLRFSGIDTPEIAGDCVQERLLALKARAFVEMKLLAASEISVITTGRRDRYDRALGHVELDGESLEEQLLSAGLAVPYVPGDIGWCERIQRGTT